MKKLMMAVAIVCAAAYANAASITWSITGIEAASTENPLSGEAYWANCFLTSDSSGQNQTFTVQQVVDWITSGVNPYDQGVVIGNMVETTGMMTANSLDAEVAIDVTGASEKNPITMHAFAVITDSYNYDPTDDSMPLVANYQIVDLGEVEFQKDANLLAGGVAANDWKSVAAPEPTSGLLLLLGVAGLALKRRRA